MAGGATADPSISADLKGKWCFDDGARVSVQRTINISLPQRLPAQEFDDKAGIRHMYMEPVPMQGLHEGDASSDVLPRESDCHLMIPMYFRAPDAEVSTRGVDREVS